MRTGSVAGIDVGGTFTDVVTLDDHGRPRAVKVPTTTADQSAGLQAGLQAADSPDVDAVAHGTTTATNAVLERRLARTVLVTTEGFKDLLVIGRQERPSLYDLSVVRPEPVIASDMVVTVAERTSPDGSVVVGLEPAEVERVVAEVTALSPESIAVCLLFGYAGPAHEQRLCEALAQLDVPMTRASELLPEFREYERASTCALDAAVAPVMRRYLGRLREQLPETAITVMTSGGGVATLDAAISAPVHTLLSGPAAGVVAAAAVARQAGYGDALAFDMGGTSTDVCLIRDGQPDIASGGTIGGLPFGTPSVAVHTVGAGGGSIGWVDEGGALRAGPQSAGAEPGPASYARGGTQPTVTDAHVILGHLLAGQSLGSSGPSIDREAARRALATLPGFDEPSAAADGMVTVVRATMLRALRRVSTERGVDPSRLALVAYGGAGPLHATALARELGCAAAVIPPAPGVLSALGLLLAPPRTEVSKTVMAVWPRGTTAPALDEQWDDLMAEASDRVADAELTRLADCRYAGQSHELRLHVSEIADIPGALDAAHTQAYGYALPDEPVEVVTLRVVATGVAALDTPPESWSHAAVEAPATTTLLIDRADVEVPVRSRASLRPGDVVEGPAVVVQPDSTTLLNPGDRAEVASEGSLVVRW